MSRLPHSLFRTEEGSDSFSARERSYRQLESKQKCPSKISHLDRERYIRWTWCAAVLALRTAVCPRMPGRDVHKPVLLIDFTRSLVEDMERKPLSKSVQTAFWRSSRPSAKRKSSRGDLTTGFRKRRSSTYSTVGVRSPCRKSHIRIRSWTVTCVGRYLPAPLGLPRAGSGT